MLMNRVIVHSRSPTREVQPGPKNPKKPIKVIYIYICIKGGDGETPTFKVGGGVKGGGRDIKF